MTAGVGWRPVVILPAAVEPRPYAKTTGTKVLGSRENADPNAPPLLAILVAYAVEPPGKLTTTWGRIKDRG